ncbi:MAG: 1-deoxy-D-xylulose-5-phosphate synthase [Defluviitaleaceae bacterium]|nr:1-deoxy-D-xylulose-5-phosphate synthase [Defluviitaleaceae bacterium]
MSYLSKIKSPDDIKGLSLEQLSALCLEIRRALVKTVSKTGGHLASNLGVTELTVALHYCFNSPEDKLIWDVGHQAYVHKMLTGRLNQMGTIRQSKGISGFPNPSESVHDQFISGHSSTAIAVGLGFCAARELKDKNHSVVSIVGDGAMTGGLSFESLNNAHGLNKNFIVVLNDNEMSISENIGGLSKALNSFRTAPSYLTAKADIGKILKSIPIVGDGMYNTADKIKGSVRNLFLHGSLFEALGFRYVGPVDGHSLKELVDVFNKSKNIKGPVLIHVCTKKGKGYLKAEKNPNFYHGVEPFNIASGEPINVRKTDTYTNVFGKTAADLAAKNDKIVAVTAAMQSNTGLNEFAAKFPRRIFDVGIAEGYAVTFSAALAKGGFIPIVAIYSTFLQRAYDQIVHDVCIDNLPVVFAIDRAGAVGGDGQTHQGVFDIAMLSNIPNMTVMAPKNAQELSEMLEFAVNLGKPVAVRYPKGDVSDVPYKSTSSIEFGKCEKIFNGESIALVSLGSMTDTAYDVCNLMKEAGLSPALINARFAKPIDLEMVDELCGYEYVFTLEDGVLNGGFGSLLLSELNKKDSKAPEFYSFGFPDEFFELGRRDEILKAYGLDTKSIFKTIMSKVAN